MSVIEFTIPGPPVPWARPMPIPFKLPSGQLRVRMVTADSTRDGELAFRLQASKYKPRKPLDGPLKMELVFVMPAPARFDEDRSRLWPHVKPDVDNLAKLVMDSLKGMFWHDDAQVCMVVTSKIYGHPPRTWVRLTQLTAEEHAAVLAMIGERVPQASLI